MKKKDKGKIVARNPVAKAARSMSYGSGYHGKTEKAERRALTVALKKAKEYYQIWTLDFSLT